MPSATEYMKRFALLMLALLGLAAACMVRAHFQRPFDDMRTHTHVGRELLKDEPHPNVVAAHVALQTMGNVVAAYVPAEALLLLSLVLLVRALRGGDPISSRGGSLRWVPLVLAALVFVAAWRILAGVFWDYPFSGDEFAYLFQADVFSHGALIEPSPPMPAFYQCNNIINNGRWYAIYPPGWPLLLAVGERAAAVDVVAPAAAACALLVLFALGRELFGARAAVFGVLLLAVSPAFILNAASYFSHQGQLLFSAAAIWLFLRARRARGSLLLPLASGLALGLAVLTRPLDCGPLVVAMALWHVALERTEPGELRSMRLLLIPLAAGMVSAVLLVCNLQQTGDPFTSGYNVDYGTGVLGVGGHSAAAGVLNTLYSSSRALVWGAPLMAELVVVCLWWRFDTHVAMLVGYATLTAIAFAFYFNLGQVEYGARYYLCAWAFLTLVAGAGADALLRRWRTSARQVVGVALFLAIFAGGGQWPGMLGAAATLHQQGATLNRWIDTTAGKKAIVFIRVTADNMAAYLNRNLCDMNAQALRVLFLDPAMNRRLRRHFSGLNACILDFDEDSRRYRLLPFDGCARSDTDLIVAGINYDVSARDTDAAIREWEGVPAASPAYLAALYDMFRVAFRQGHHAQVTRLARTFLRKNDAMAEVYFLWGRSLLSEDRSAQAVMELEKAVARYPGGSVEGDRARRWLEEARLRLGSIIRGATPQSGPTAKP